MVKRKGPRSISLLGFIFYGLLNLFNLNEVVVIRQTCRMKDVDTTLYRLILYEFPALECVDVRQCRIVSVSDLIADVHLIIVDSVDDTICSLRTQNYDKLCRSTKLIRTNKVVYSAVRCNNCLCKVELNRPD